MYSPSFHKAPSLRAKISIEEELANAQAKLEKTESDLAELSTSGSQHGDAVERRAYLQYLMNSKFYYETMVNELNKELGSLNSSSKAC
ncbi:hypothetical protein [Legionella sp. km772]|uniref:hypothetical protein n=1 Tax=Legionella sp. km772 TaxID=2498111 RepID=UPI000F8CE035|nr:hypothetical protein [Legionella sp. km772]RUR12410.1 hypothetical protein ELY15_05140 [Legionella sp. km772]